jgi:DNA polymerase elongation subunit (family B)
MKIDNYANVYVTGNKILVRGFDESGSPQYDIIDDFKPTYYIPTSKEKTNTGLGETPLTKVSHNNIFDARNWLKEMKTYGVDVYGNIDIDAQYIATLPKKRTVTKDDLTIIIYDIETTVEHNLTIAEMLQNPIEEITLISTYCNKDNEIHLFFSRPIDIDEVNRHSDDSTKNYKVVFNEFENERQMLLGFVKYWKTKDPHVISGWNTAGFDDVYIHERIKQEIGETVADSLSPYGKVRTRNYFDSVTGKPAVSKTFAGIASLDYLDIYKTYTFHSMLNYKLDTIAEYECRANKLHHDGSFRDFYTNHWNKFVAYNIRDTVLVNEIDKATDLMSVAITVAYTCNANLSDTFGTVKKLDYLVYNFLKRDNIEIPPIRRNTEESFPGGYVAEPRPGMYRAVASFDANSLYPHMIMESNISPEAQIPYDDLPEEIQRICDEVSIDSYAQMKVNTSVLKSTNITVTAAGVAYDTSKKGFASKMMYELYQGRKDAKKKSLVHKVNYTKAKEEDNDDLYETEFRMYTIYHNLQMALKILLNSFYGAYSNVSFRYYSLDHAKSITMNGQASIKHVAEKVNEFLRGKIDPEGNFVAYIDTDSNYYDLSLVLKKAGLDPIKDYDKSLAFLKKFVDGPLANFINEVTQNWADYRNCPENKLVMEREAISVRGGIFVAKKKYCLFVDDMEGVSYSKENPYVKGTGLEMAKAGTVTKHIRDALTDVVTLMTLDGEDALQSYVTKFKDEFMSLPIEEISLLSAVNEIDKWLDSSKNPISGTPAQVKAALRYNKWLDSINDPDTVRVAEGDKIYIVPLRTNNPTGFATIGYHEWYGSITKLEPYVDKVLLWKKNFVTRAEIMTGPAKMTLTKKNKLFG